VQVWILGRGLSEGLARWRAPRAAHGPGKIVADLPAAVALGGDCLADVAVLREQPVLAGPVASDPVVSRLVAALAGDQPRALQAIRAAWTAARERAWALAGDAAPGGAGLVTVDLDWPPVVRAVPARWPALRASRPARPLLLRRGRVRRLPAAQPGTIGQVVQAGQASASQAAAWWAALERAAEAETFFSAVLEFITAGYKGIAMGRA